LSEQPFSPSGASVADADTAHENPGMVSRLRARQALVAQGKRVQKLRVDKGWSRTTLAAKAGVTVTTIRGCETAVKVTQPEKLRKIATALGISLKRLEASDETQDARVRHWTTEDYEIGNWYHNAPRSVKNWMWALQETPQAAVAAAFDDPHFLRLLQDWVQLTPWERSWVLKALDLAKNKPQQSEGEHDAFVPPPEPKVRGPQR
jgi:transcriptional regulator with XRE-family HTH domain